MNILLLAPHPFYVTRGTPIAVKLLCQELAAMGHAIDVLTYHEGEPVSIHGVNVHRIPRPPLVRHVPIGPSWQKIFCDLAMVRVLRRMIRQTRYDLIHAVEESAFMAARCSLPFVFDMDSLMSRQLVEKSKLFWPVAKVFQWLERHALRRCVGAVAVCPALADEARKHQKNVHLLPDVAMDCQSCVELPKAITGAKGLRFMYVGNLEAYQGVDVMINAFALAAKGRDNTTLVVVGGKPEDIERYQRMTKALGLDGRVIFAGPVPVESLGRVLECADVLVSPRIKGNNTPMKLYSYLLSGKPVLATRLPMHTQVVTDDQAVLVEPTAEGLANGMRCLMESRKMRDAIGAAGRQLAESTYSLPAFRERLQKFYTGITP